MLELIIWRSFTGLFAGSLILVQAYDFTINLNDSVVADVTETSDRNIWLARMEGFICGANIIGPALGAIFLKVNSRFPL